MLKLQNYDHIIHDYQNGKKGSNFVQIRASCQSTSFDVYQAAVVSFGHNCCFSTLLNCQLVRQ